VTKSVEVNRNEFIIREREGYQLPHQCDLISYLSIESIDDYRDDSIAHTLPRVASSAMPKPVLLQFAVNDSQLTIVGHFSRAVHLQRIRAGLRNTRDSRRSTSLTAVAIAITFYATRWSYLRYGCCVEFQQRLCNDSTMITDTITDIIIGIMVYRRAELKIVEQRSQIVLQLRKGSIITPEYSKVASRYDSQLPLSIIPFGTL